MLRGDSVLIAGAPYRLLETGCARMSMRLFALSRDRRAVTALEYAILAAALGLVLLTLFSDFQEKLSMLFAPIGQSIPAPPTTPPPP
jgi:Flp pilus assembly pilin Flp